MCHVVDFISARPAPEVLEVANRYQESPREPIYKSLYSSSDLKSLSLTLDH